MHRGLGEAERKDPMRSLSGYGLGLEDGWRTMLEGADRFLHFLLVTLFWRI